MSKLKENDLDMAYSVYVTDSLFLQGKGMRYNKRWIDIVHPRPETDTQEEADDIVKDIIERAGLICSM